MLDNTTILLYHTIIKLNIKRFQTFEEAIRMKKIEKKETKNGRIYYYSVDDNGKKTRISAEKALEEMKAAEVASNETAEIETIRPLGSKLTEKVLKAINDEFVNDFTVEVYHNGKIINGDDENCGLTPLFDDLKSAIKYARTEAANGYTAKVYELGGIFNFTLVYEISNKVKETIYPKITKAIKIAEAIRKAKK